MMKDDYRYTGTLFNHTPLTSPIGVRVASGVRSAVADHLRLLKTPSGKTLAGKRRVQLPDGTIIETHVNPFGLAPIISTRVFFPTLKPIEEETQKSYYMEVGLLTWDTVANIEIHTPGWLADYIASAGTSLIDGDAVLVGTVKADLESEELTWGPAPEPDENGVYATIPWASMLSTDNPEMYTGLARRWAAARVGSGKTIVGGVPAGMSGLSTETGVLRFLHEDQYQWWLVQASTDGCLAAPLVPDVAFAPLVEWLSTSAEEDSLGAAFVEAWILQTATAGEPVTILSSAAMAALYGGRGYVAHGWHWTPQNWGTAGETTTRCDTTLWDGGTGIGSAWRIISQRVWLTFALVDGVPVATTGSNSSVSWTPGDTQMRLDLPYSVFHWATLQPPAGTVATGDNGPVYCFYKPDGSRVEVKGSIGVTEVQNHPVLDWTVYSSMCGAGTQSGSNYYRTGQRLGWEVTGITVDPFVTEVTGSTTNTYTLVEGEVVEWPPSYSIDPEDGTYSTELGGGTCGSLVILGPYPPPSEDPPSAPPQPLLRTPVGAGTSVTTTAVNFNNGTGARRLVIGYVPGTVLAMTSNQWTYVSSFTQVVTRLYDSTLGAGTAGVIKEELDGESGTYRRDVSVEVAAGSVSTVNTPLTGAGSSFAVQWYDAAGVVHSSDEPSYWSAWSVLNPEGLWISIANSVGDAVSFVTSGNLAPEGLETPKGNGIWVGL